MITMATNLWRAPGVHNWKQTERPLVGGNSPEQILLLDGDMTLWDTASLMPSVGEVLTDFAGELGVRPNLFHQATTSILAREEVHNVEFAIVEVVRLLGERLRINLDPDALNEAFVRPYMTRLIETERLIRPFDGVVEGLAEIRRRWPKVLILLHTNCPTWMALLRAYFAGVLCELDALLGVDPHIPEDITPATPTEDEHPLWTCIQCSLDLMRDAVDQLPAAVLNRLQLVGAMPFWYSKETTDQPRGVETILDWADPDGKLVTVSCGDNPFSEGRLAARFNVIRKRSQNPVRYVQARYGYPNAVVPADVAVHARLRKFADLIDVLQQTWGG
jgi:hypothetical protein